MRYRGLLYGLAWRSARRRRPEKASTSADFVYAILGSHGLVKVGFSNDPAARIRELQTGSPFALSLAYSHPTYGLGAAVEGEAHVILARHRQGGEWFAVPVDVAVAAISAAAYRLSVAAAQEAKPRWWLRYAVLTAIAAPVWTYMTPAPFIAVAAGVMFWACFRLMRYQGAFTLQLATRWLVTCTGAVLTSAMIALPFVPSHADDAQWIRKGATLCESEEDLASAKKGDAAKCIAAPMAMRVEIDGSSGAAARIKVLGISSGSTLWTDPHSLEDEPSEEEMSPD